jgi:very-short-patch-repair endonuclease
MEARVLDWLQKTAFFQNHRDSVEILPQFPIGDYLRQLDPTYQHPAWRVDFLITFSSPKGIAKIVLEYDGFEFHFQKSDNVNVGNHERYMLEADVERQLTLESYGYRFLRLNRFNLGKDPVRTLSDRLERLVESLADDHEPGSVQTLRNEAEDLASGKLKACPKCGLSRKPEEFFDPYLKEGKGGMGRNCKFCKINSSNSPHRHHWRRW